MSTIKKNIPNTANNINNFLKKIISKLFIIPNLLNNNIIELIIYIVLIIYIIFIAVLYLLNISKSIHEIIIKLLLNNTYLNKLDLLSNLCYNTRNNYNNNTILSLKNLIDNDESNYKFQYGIPIQYKEEEQDDKNDKNNDNDDEDENKEKINEEKKFKDLYICDFYWKFSYKTYLTSGINNGRPTYDAIKNALNEHNIRGVNLDIYSNKKNVGDVTAIPVVRTDSLYNKSKSLDLFECFRVIKNNGWNESKDYKIKNLPIILYLTMNFTSDPIIYNKIYYAIIKNFGKELMGKKYSYNGRNGIYPINKIKMKDAFRKIIIISNIYPTNSKLDEVINGSVLNNKISYISIDRYSNDMHNYSGLTIKYPKNEIINNNKNNLFMVYSDFVKEKNNVAISKIDLSNPNIVDCIRLGVQFPMMSLYLPNSNLINWRLYFDDNSVILKNKELRNTGEDDELI